MKKLGIVLSGGGVRGMAHIGLLQALREQNIEADILAGTSAGAMVGALYAKGYSMQQMVEAFQSAPLFSPRNITIFKPGIIDTIRLRRVIKHHFPNNAFEELEIPLYINSTNLRKGTSVIHHTGKLYRPLLASMSLPFFFSPIRIGKDLHADGGIMDNFPVEVIRDKCEVLIGSYVCPLENCTPKKLNYSLGVLWRSYELNFYAASQAKFDLCNYVFEPPQLCGISTLDKRGIEQAYEIGYKYAQSEMNFILDTIYGVKKRTMTNTVAA